MAPAAAAATAASTVTAADLIELVQDIFRFVNYSEI